MLDRIIRKKEKIEYDSQNPLLNIWQQWCLQLDSFELSKTSIAQVKNTIIFIESLRREIEKIVPAEYLVRRKYGGPLELSYRRLNIFLGEIERFFEKRIEYCKTHPSYSISFDKLLNMIVWIKIRFGGASISAINLVHSYLNFHKLNIPFSHNNELQIYNHHPLFNKKYFSSIDTTEKAYWLGFIFADGTIINGKRISLYLSASTKYIKSNHHQIIRFCKALGLNLDYIDFIHRLDKDETIQYHHFILIQFSSKEMADDLYKLGFKGSRSKATEWPKIEKMNPLLDLAILLGFYDGEADVGRTRINSANKVLLEYIKSKFNIPYKVLPTENAYTLSLSGQLVNLMQAIVPKSLGLKRHDFKKRNTKLIFNKILTKGILRELIEIMSEIKIAEIFGMEVEDIYILLERWGIKSY